MFCGVRREAALRRPHTEGGERRKYRGGRPPTACCVYLDNFRKAFDTVVTTFTPKLVISTADNTLLLGWQPRYRLGRIDERLGGLSLGFESFGLGVGLGLLFVVHFPA